SFCIMDDPQDNLSIKSGASEDDFGFVKRDSEVAAGSVQPETGEDVTSGPELESIEEDGTGNNVRKVASTSDDIPQPDKLGTVYDASKRKATTVNKPKPPGILRRTASSVLNTKPSAPAAEGQPMSKEEDLPQTFQVKYLGQRDARGLWGIKHTRRPVDSMVSAAKNLKAGTVLPLMKLVVSKEGVSISQIGGHKKDEIVKFHRIDTISYGVQDLVYTRVFSMIIVKEMGDLKGQHPFECHAFVCESRNGARKLTYALAAAFHEYSKVVKASGGENSKEGLASIKKKFAIDLRSPEEIEADLKSPHMEDSEA
ncbi:hypothetical protein L9F63_015363, partial [Diploptera punctata]